MKFSALLVLALGLAMDAVAAAASRGLAVPVLRLRHFVSVSLFFGGFQAAMPFFGWLLGRSVSEHVVAWDHWIAFVLLSAIGLKMIHEALSNRSEVPTEVVGKDPFALQIMTMLAFATSVDAFAAGITLPMLGAPLLLSLTTIGLTTALLSTVGLVIGHRFGAVLGHRLDVFGGAVLVLLGTKILIEHLSAS